MLSISDRFEAPAPGAWELETVHQSRPVSRWMAEIFPEAATAGFRAGMAEYGLLLEVMEFTVVNGFVYVCARGVGAPKDAKGPPPKLIFKILVRVHPEIRRRVRRSAEVFETKAWRRDIERWDNEWKPAIERELRALQSVDARALPTDALIRHLEACRDAVSRAITMHHRLNPVAMIAIGDFLVQVGDWTGMSPSELLPLMRGASAVSLGAIAELQRLVAEIAGRDDIRLLLAGSDPSAILESLTSQPGTLGAAACDYIDAVGIRGLTGYDVSDMSLADAPAVIVETIRTAVAGESHAAADTLAADIARVRERVPAQHRDEFDELLAEARLTYRIRDERGYSNDAWAIGIARRALLAAGERLVAAGRLEAASHAFDLTPSELASALAGGEAPSAAEVAAYAEYRSSKTVADAPRILGSAPSPPPPPEWLSGPAARAARIIQTVMGEMFANREPAPAAARTLRGFAASPGEFVGVARLVLSSADMANVKPGDVLVARATGPSYNAVLPLIRGVITDRGGTLSHAALVAREYGIPAVVGCENATALIADGARIRIDGTNGQVHIL